MWNYASLFVPGLLQTEDYARAVIRGGLPHASRDEVERRVEVRMERQAVLRNDNPLNLWSIVDEAALRRQVGGLEVMQAQFRYLVEVSELPYVTFQVIPFDAGAHPGMTGSFILLQFDDVAIPDVIYVDTMTGEPFLEEVADVRRYSSSSSTSVQWPPAGGICVAGDVRHHGEVREAVLHGRAGPHGCPVVQEQL